MLGWTKYLGFSQSSLNTQKANSADLCTELGQPACQFHTASDLFKHHTKLDSTNLSQILG